MGGADHEFIMDLSPKTGSTGASPDSVDRGMVKEILEGLGGDVGFFSEVIGAYLDSVPEGFELFRKALKEGDADAVCLLAHGLKSSSAQFGAHRMAHIFVRLEKVGKSGQLAEAGELIRLLESEFAPTRVELEASALQLGASVQL